MDNYSGIMGYFAATILKISSPYLEILAGPNPLISSRSEVVEGEAWEIYNKGKGCEVALQLEVNGIMEIIPMFYIDMDTELVYAVDNPLNFGIPSVNLQYLKPVGDDKLP